MSLSFSFIVYLFLISNFRLVLNVVCFLLGDIPASEFYMPTFRNALAVPSSEAGRYEDGTECSEKLAYKIQTSGNCPEETKWSSLKTSS